MTDDTPVRETNDPLDDLVDELLECGAVLSQMISGMVRFEASGRAVPDSAPIPDVAHDLIRSVSIDLRHQHSRRDIKVAAKIVKQVTEAICSDIFIVDPDELDRLLAEQGDDMDPV